MWTRKKIKHDEARICERLIAKYGEADADDTHEKMFRDIKLNYLQWSKGQIGQKLKAFRDGN